MPAQGIKINNYTTVASLKKAVEIYTKLNESETNPAQKEETKKTIEGIQKAQAKIQQAYETYKRKYIIGKTVEKDSKTIPKEDALVGKQKTTGKELDELLSMSNIQKAIYDENGIDVAKFETEGTWEVENKYLNGTASPILQDKDGNWSTARLENAALAIGIGSIAIKGLFSTGLLGLVGKGFMALAGFSPIGATFLAAFAVLKGVGLLRKLAAPFITANKQKQERIAAIYKANAEVAELQNENPEELEQNKRSETQRALYNRLLEQRYAKEIGEVVTDDQKEKDSRDLEALKTQIENDPLLNQADKEFLIKKIEDIKKDRGFVSEEDEDEKKGDDNENSDDNDSENKDEDEEKGEGEKLKLITSFKEIKGKVEGLNESSKVEDFILLHESLKRGAFHEDEANNCFEQLIEKLKKKTNFLSDNIHKKKEEKEIQTLVESPLKDVECVKNLETDFLKIHGRAPGKNKTPVSAENVSEAIDTLIGRSNMERFEEVYSILAALKRNGTPLDELQNNFNTKLIEKINDINNSSKSEKGLSDPHLFDEAKRLIKLCSIYGSFELLEIQDAVKKAQKKYYNFIVDPNAKSEDIESLNADLADSDDKDKDTKFDRLNIMYKIATLGNPKPKDEAKDSEIKKWEETCVQNARNILIDIRSSTLEDDEKDVFHDALKEKALSLHIDFAIDRNGIDRDKIKNFVNALQNLLDTLKNTSVSETDFNKKINQFKSDEAKHNKNLTNTVENLLKTIYNKNKDTQKSAAVAEKVYQDLGLLNVPIK